MTRIWNLIAHSAATPYVWCLLGGVALAAGFPNVAVAWTLTGVLLGASGRYAR